MLFNIFLVLCYIPIIIVSLMWDTKNTIRFPLVNIYTTLTAYCST